MVTAPTYLIYISRSVSTHIDPPHPLSLYRRLVCVVVPGAARVGGGGDHRVYIYIYIYIYIYKPSDSNIRSVLGLTWVKGALQLLSKRHK